MKTTKQRGGTQIGWVNTSWPLASIEVETNLMCVNSMGKYIFSPIDVLGIEEVGSIPFFFQGLRIHHQKSEYPEKIVFLTLYGRESLIDATRAAGFKIGQPVNVVKRGFPFRTPAVIAVLVVWNLLFFLDRENLESPTKVVGPYMLFALAVVFSLATLLPKSPWLQKLFMREGRNTGEVSSLLRLLQLVSGLMALGVSCALYFFK
jgi:hypothetical protein